MNKLILVIDVADGIDEDDIVDYISNASLWTLQKNEKMITDYTWHYKEDIHIVRGMALVELIENL